MVMIAAASVCVLSSEADAYESGITADKNILKTGGTGTFTAVYNNTDYDDAEKYTDVSHDIRYTAKLVNSAGETQTSGVSPSSGEVGNNEHFDLTVTAPSSTGNYKLMVDFEDKITYKEVGDAEAELKDVKAGKSYEYSIKVVEPVKLSVTVDVSSESKVDLNAYGVYFEIDGKKMDDSYTTFSSNSDGTFTASYEYVADLSDGTYKYRVIPADGSIVTIEGLDSYHTFYIGDKSYTAYIAVSIIFVVIMILVLVWVLRKPVKNFGKPKSRR